MTVLKNIATDQAVFGAVIAHLRENKRLKQQELAEKLGVHPSTWSRIEKGETSLSADQLGALSKALGISSDEIFRYVDEAKAALPRSGIDVVSMGVLRKIGASAASGALFGAVAGGFLPIAGPALGAVIGGLIGHLLSSKDKQD